MRELVISRNIDWSTISIGMDKNKYIRGICWIRICVFFWQDTRVDHRWMDYSSQYFLYIYSNYSVGLYNVAYFLNSLNSAELCNTQSNVFVILPDICNLLNKLKKFKSFFFNIPEMISARIGN